MDWVIVFSIGMVVGGIVASLGIFAIVRGSLSYETIDGRWYLFLAGRPLRPLSDQEAARVIWG